MNVNARIQYLIDNQINFLAGTMASAWPDNNYLESIETVFDYYQKNGVIYVDIEPKMMGSRVQIYTNTDKYVDRIITRSGSSINCGADILTPLEANSIYDGELLPWRALGGDLINKTFLGYFEAAIREECLLSKYGKLNRHSLNNLIKFKKELDKYNSNVYSYVYCFRRLKANNDVVYERINYADAIVNWPVNTPLTTVDVLSRFDTYEGVVVKPVGIPPKGVCPYFKVRNSEFLRLIFGANYDDKDNLDILKNRDLSKKISRCITEFELGQEMLKIPSTELSCPEFVRLVCEFWRISKREMSDLQSY